ncbi:MAG: fatty acid--CoA ligase family protein, partial [Gammaproteobacteria bacterium]
DDAIIPDQLDQYEMDFEPMAIDAQDIALIGLSSGTTGIPKGVIHRNGPLVESARGGAYIWGSNPHSCQLVPISTSFIGWSNAVFPFMNVGAKSVFMAHFHPLRYVETLVKEKCTTCVLIPTIWRMLFQMDISGYDLSNIELAGFAGEVIDSPTLEKIRTQITPNIINIYGTTETLLCGGTIMFAKDMTPERIESVGKPLLNGEIRIIEPGGSVNDVLPPNEEGEIIVSGPSVANEMWADPALSRKVFEDGWWHSGDLGRLDDENFLYIEGRIDDMIISGGINVMPAPIEQTILDHPAVAEVAVVGLPDEQWGQRIAAFVCLTDPTVTDGHLSEFVEQSDLSHYQRPREYRILDELPKGPTGKLSRKSLRE